MTTKIEQGTLYLKGEFFGNIVRVEARNISIEVKPYAQYLSAVWITFTPKGKRNPRRVVQTYEPSAVVLEGWGHVEPQAGFTPPKPTGVSGVMESRSLYSSFDSRWQSDFDGLLAEYLQKTGVRVVADFRNHNAHDRFVGTR